MLHFHAGAMGTPSDWNDKKNYLVWNNRNLKLFPQAAQTSIDISKFIDFLSLRPDRDGHPISESIGEPQYMESGWFRCNWLDFNEDTLPANSSAGGLADWQRAWHGCKIEGLYSIMYHRKLWESREGGDRFFPGKPGVYFHKDGTAAKVANYMRFVHLFGDGVFWAAKWEVRVDRTDRVSKSGTDQWVQKERSVRLAALWLLGRRHENMERSDEVVRFWNPLHEANPQDNRRRISGKQASQLDDDESPPEETVERPVREKFADLRRYLDHRRWQARKVAVEEAQRKVTGRIYRRRVRKAALPRGSVAHLMPPRRSKRIRLVIPESDL
jgi:hypothetical protein